ncbi:hypothetical protein [Amycolatopsis antarctica]|uniref:hypothetical protein n=1 Tax=Amycolatopsis antarctica TaxID=1854586 RepID=UPI001F0AD8C6|nr:hypothetical protein [Amycolatopsis antarctica]
MAGVALPVSGEEGTHAFRLDLTAAVLTSVEGDTLVVRSWHPGAAAVRWERQGSRSAARVDG